jgi:hypothetical protein
MAGKGAPCAAALGFSADGFGDAAVEALDETVGLRPVRSGQAVINLVVGADQIERVLAGRPAGGLFFISTAKRSVNSAPLSVRMV